MILTEIYIPAVDSEYDFMLDENVPAAQIMEEITSVILKKVNETGKGDLGEFLLYSRDEEKCLDLKKSLHRNGIRDGSIGRIRWDGDGQDGGPVKKAFEKDLNAIWVAVRKLERIYRYAVNAKEKYEGCEQSVRALISTMH